MSSGEMSEVDSTLETEALGWLVPPAARALVTAGRRWIARACGRIERRTLAEILDDVLERLNLRRQFAGRRAVVAVLGFQRGRRRAEPIDFRVRAPSARPAQ